jgi:hypothetical protein
MTFIISASPLETKGKDRRVVKNKELRAAFSERLGRLFG